MPFPILPVFCVPSAPLGTAALHVCAFKSVKPFIIKMVLFSFCISHLGMVLLQTGGAHCSLYVDSFKIHII